MLIIDDGRVAISYEPRGGTIRALPDIPGDDDHHPDYTSVGQADHLHAELVKLHGFRGDITRRHMRLIVRLLLEQGYRVAYIDRAPGRVMPLATRIEQGDWAGWWRLDLVAVRLAAPAAHRRAYSVWRAELSPVDCRGSEKRR